MNPETVSQKTYEQKLLITSQKYLQKVFPVSQIMIIFTYLIKTKTPL